MKRTKKPQSFAPQIHRRFRRQRAVGGARFTLPFGGATPF